MSSDKSEDECETRSIAALQRRPTYHVTMPRWRAQSVTRWIHTLDGLHMIGRRICRSRGAFPRRHIYSQDKISKSTKVINHLPSNVYDDMWLEEQRKVEDDLFSLRPVPVNYDLSIDPAIYK